jgi:hypothetical protein
MPILGIMASSMQGVVGAYESIQTVSVGAGGTASISFTSIPSTYKHLQIRGILKGNNGLSTDDTAILRFNSDTATNYSYHTIYANGGASVNANLNGATVSFINTYGIPSSGFTSTFSSTILDILNYANTSFYKTVRWINGFDSNGNSNSIDYTGGNWRSTSAITSITISPTSGATAWLQYSHLALYGVK